MAVVVMMRERRPKEDLPEAKERVKPLFTLCSVYLFRNVDLLAEWLPLLKTASAHILERVAEAATMELFPVENPLSSGIYCLRHLTPHEEKGDIWAIPCSHPVTELAVASVKIAQAKSDTVPPYVGIPGAMINQLFPQYHLEEQDYYLMWKTVIELAMRRMLYRVLEHSPYLTSMMPWLQKDGKGKDKIMADFIAWRKAQIVLFPYLDEATASWMHKLVATLDIYPVNKTE